MGIITIDAVFLIIGTALIIGIIILLLIMLNKCRRMAKKQRNLINKIKESNKTAEIRRKFFAKISHEMRTPLNIIIGLSELELGSFDDEQGESNPVLEKIYSAGMNLLSIINDLLDITKLESGKLRLIPAIYDISSLINDTMNMNILKIGSKPIQFRLHVDSNLPSYLEGDRLRVKQVFSNLISNAIKFTNSGFVDWNITCKREEDRVKIISTVSDTGIGIRKEKIEKLFDKNIYSMDFKANNYNEGIGMGISITNDLVTLMGGTISVKSEQGTGSVFTVEFYQKVIGDEIIGEKLAETLSEFKYLERRRSINRKIFRANMSYATVLVVDDVITNLDVARGMLKLYKMNVECAKSGKEAIELIKNGKVRYNAIFMDHMMPEMDGFETVKIIRNEIDNEYAKKVPIIALTANAIFGNEEKFLENGFNAFLSKPIDIIRMDQVLNQWVRNKEAEAKLPSEALLPAEKDLHTTNKTEEGKNMYLKKINIPGLNAMEGMLRFGNDEEVYLKILQSYTVHTPEFLKKMKDWDDINSYRIAAHSIKGSGKSIGANELGSLAEKLEHAAKDSDIEYIKENNQNLIDVAEKLLNSIKEFIKDIPFLQGNKNAGKNEKNAPDPELISLLKESVENYDIDGLNDCITKIAEFSYKSHPDLVSWLQEKAGKSEFEAIKERLDTLDK